MMDGVTLSGAELGDVHFGSLQHGGRKDCDASAMGTMPWSQRHNQVFT